jgi:uncharacterized protein YegL
MNSRSIKGGVSPTMPPLVRTCLAQLVLYLAAVMVSWQSVHAQSYYGIVVPNAPVIFLLDVSGSMEELDEGRGGNATTRGRAIGEVQRGVGRILGNRAGRVVGTRLRREATDLGAATRELTEAILTLRSGTPFTIITFGGSVSEWREGFVRTNSTTRILATTHVQRLSAGGGTPMLQALRRAFARRDVQTIFLVSDGAPTDASAGEVIRVIQALNSRRLVAVHTIGVGADQQSELLCQLAQENHGVYVTARQVRCRGDSGVVYPRQVERGSRTFARRVMANLDATNTMEIVTRDPYLGIELRSLSIGPDGLLFRVRAFELDHRGKVIPQVSDGTARDFGGQFIHRTTHTFEARANEYGTLWRIYVPPQQSPGLSDSDGVDMYVEYNPLPSRR